MRSNPNGHPNGGENLNGGRNGLKGPAGMNGIHGIKSIHMGIAKGQNYNQGKEEFLGHNKRGSIDSDPNSYQYENSALGVSADQQFIQRGNGGSRQFSNGYNQRQLGAEGLQVGGSPQQRAMNGNYGMFNSYSKPGQNGHFDPYGRNGMSPQANTTTGKNRYGMDANILGFKFAAGLYNRFQSQKSKPGALVSTRINYEGDVNQRELPETPLDAIDYTRRLDTVKELKSIGLDAWCKWKKKDQRGIKKNAYIKDIQKRNAKILTKQTKDPLEQLEVATDRFPLLAVRKAIKKFIILVQMLSKAIIETKTFENLTILVIVANSAVMVIEDPNEKNPSPTFKMIDDIFNILYTTEMCLKIMGLGFIFNEGAYLRDSWNILDFVIVISALIPYIQNEEEVSEVRHEIGPKPATGGGSEISGLRAFRVMRPLRTITSIKGLKVLITALFAAIPMLGDTLMVLMFFFVVFSIACLQLLAGMLKQRCVSIQTGMVHPDDILCGSGMQECPGGFFCGKQNANPNYGVTNFDSIQYSLLNVFICISLEGWSEIQSMMQLTFNFAIFILFILMVLLGAFFLLNLLLAVINSKFTEAHSEHEAHEQEELRKKRLKVSLEEGDNEDNMNYKDEFTISQAITAKIYIKKMKAYLYKRREMKTAIELRRQENKKQRQASQQARRAIPGVPNTTNGFPTMSITSNGNGKNGLGYSNGNGNGNGNTPVTGTIIEVDGEHHEEQLDEGEKHMADVQDLLMTAKLGMAREGKNIKDLRVRMAAGTAHDQYKNIGAGARLKDTSLVSNPVVKNGLPTMMGNIGNKKHKFLDPVSQMKVDKHQTNLYRKIAEEVDIDKIIPEEVRKKQAAEDVVDDQSLNSFGISMDNYEHGEQERQNSSRGGLANSTMDGNGLKLLVGHKNNDDLSGGLITSDSDFEAEAEAAGHQNFINVKPTKKQNAINKRNSGELKKDVSKTFKKMLTQNNKRSGGQFKSALDETGNGNESTKYEGSRYDGDHDANTQISDIESKFVKKKKNMKQIAKAKMYKEDFEEDEIDNLKEANNQQLNKDNNEMFNLKQLEEFINTKKPKDPFLELKPLTEKVVINPKSKYNGASQAEIFHERTKKQQINDMILENQFLRLPEKYRDVVDPDFADTEFVRNQWLPYQQKVEYDADPDSSDVEDALEGNNSPNDDARCAEEQPYETPTSIGYSKMLKQIPIVELARRSDIVITSTLSQNLIAKDKRLINTKCFALMDKPQLREYLNEHAAFKADEWEIKNKQSRIKDKEKEFRDNYSKSFINRAQFKSKTLKLFKKGVKILNSNKKTKPVKDTRLKELEKMKHEQLKRAAEKRGLPDWKEKRHRDDAHRLLEGKYHDDDEEEEEDEENAKKKLEPDLGQVLLEQKKQCQTCQLEQMENEINKIFDTEDAMKRQLQDEIPTEIRRQFKFPDKLNEWEINFKKIRLHDANKKRSTPLWSGQEVLPDKLDYDKSLNVVEIINKHRVWPTGLIGLWKRIRYVLRLHVKSSFFDNFMTFLVVLNTMTLSLEQHNMPEELSVQLEGYNQIFTYLFIYEMGSKLLAIGVKKYIDDRMNWLDGSVVLLSIFEIIYAKMQEGKGVNLSAFKTMRLFRTFRVFRIARLLRALSSMQMIMSVIAASYMSYIYITALLFLFIFIFMLLGMQMFGGKMNYQDGLPRGNYDTPGIAFLSVFQVLTMENWPSLLFDMMRGEIDKWLASLYLIVWIFLGNFILLNLFLAILLDSFNPEEVEEEDDDVRLIRIQQKQIRAEERQKRKNRKKVLMNLAVLHPKHHLHKVLQDKQPEDEDEDLEDLDEDQKVKAFQKLGIMKKTREEILKEMVLFDGVECQMSIYLFSKENCFRIGCYKLWKHKMWEQIVMSLILLSSLKLATDTYNNDITSQFALNFLENVDLFFNYAFIIEMTVKVIAMGLVMDEGSYLTDSWNQLDFFIVTSSIFDMALADFDLPFIRILRMLRVLRPLRFISRNVGLKMIVVALLDSVGHIFNVFIVLAMVYLVFAILGVNFMAGYFFYCSIDPYILHTQIECEVAGGSWNRWDHNFDNVPQAYVSLYVVSSLEGWPDICIQALDMVDVDTGPAFQASVYMMSYFVFFILIGSFFLLNFFIGVLFLKFNEAQAEEQKGLSPKDMGWQDIQKLILQTEPEYKTTNVPKNIVRRYFHDLVSSDRFDLAIMSCIILNMLQMALYHEGMNESIIWLMDFTNIIFTIVFILEAILKLIAYGKSYFENSWNKFDFFVVVSSIMDFVLSAMNSQALDSIKTLPQIARVMRVLRVTRLLKFAEGLQSIIQTIVFAIPSLANVFMLLMLIFFMFAVAGNAIFSEVKYGEAINELKNFGNFHSAFILLFALATGEDWNKVMFDCSRTEADDCIEGETCGSGFAFAYFGLLVLICTHVMLNLFILVIIQQFEKYYLPKDNMINQFKDDLNSFLKVWKKETMDKYRCLKIKEKMLTKFFRDLGEEQKDKSRDDNLGFQEEQYEAGELKKEVLKMAIKSVDGHVYFNELLYRCMRRKYVKHRQAPKMKEEELYNQYQIFLMTMEIHEKGQVAQKIDNEKIKHHLVKKEQAVNPFLTVMNFRITFMAWSRKAKANLNLVEKQVNKTPREVQIEQEQEYSTTSEEEEEYDADGRPVMSRSRSGIGLAVSMSGMSGSKGSDSDRGSMKKKSLKTKNHLQRFEKKMTMKFQKFLVDNRLRTSEKKGISIDMEAMVKEDLNAKIKRSITKRQKQMNDLNTSVKVKKSNEKDNKESTTKK